MAMQPIHVILTIFLCLRFCNSLPQHNVNIILTNFVLDGKSDCKLGDSADAIKLFKAHQCPQYIKKFSGSYFDDRDIFPCFGIYDSLYHLCEFSKDKVNLKTPDSFKKPDQFCVEAKRVYTNLNFSYNGEEIKKWSSALNKTMQEETGCKNLCIMNTEVNEQCVAMLTLANEYLRLIELSEIEKPIQAVGEQNGEKKKDNLKDVIQSSLDNPVIAKVNKSNLQPTVPLKSGSKIEESQKPVVVENKSKQTGVVIATSSNLNEDVKNPTKVDEAVKQTDATAILVSSAVAVPEKSDTKKANVEDPLNSQQMPEHIPVAEKSKDFNTPSKPISHIQKVPSNVELESMPEDSVTQQVVDENHGIDPLENVDGVAAETKEKGFEDEEIEKPNEEEKPVVETDQHSDWPGMPNGFNPIRDSYAESEDSYSFTYIVTTMAALCAVYLLFHYRNKLLALALEGRKGKSSRGRGRPSSANYSKLHSNLEEAIASNVTAPSATHVLY